MLLVTVMIFVFLSLLTWRPTSGETVPPPLSPMNEKQLVSFNKHVFVKNYL